MTVDCAVDDYNMLCLVGRKGVECDPSQPVSALHDVGQRNVTCFRVARDTRDIDRAQFLVVMTTVATTETLAAIYSCGTRQHVDVYRCTVSQWTDYR